MKKTRMRVWSILLTVLMLLTLLPISTMAAEAPVAMIGETTYTSLYNAVAEARDGDTIKLLSDASGCGIIINSSKYATDGLTIDFNGFTYTVDESPLAGSSGTKSQCFQLLTGGKVTMKGGTVNSTNTGVAMVLQNYCDLTLDGMVIDGSGMTRTDGTYTMSNNCGNVVIKDTTVIAKEGDVAFDVYGGFQKYGDVTVTVTGSSVIDGKVEVARGNGTQNKNTLNIEGGTFNNEIVVTDNEKTSVTVSGGAFSKVPTDYIGEDVTQFVCNGVTYVGTSAVDGAHSWKLISTLKPATCTADGLGKFACEYCDATKYAIIPAEHTWELTETVKEATCGEAGQAKYTCSVCGETKNEEIPATGEHDFEESLVDATCTENAKVGMVCKNCGATEGEMEEVPETALGHDLQEDPESLVEPTCTEAGSVTLKCSRCDYTEEKTLDALGHTPGEPEMVEPTCTENGKSVVKCAVCGEILESDDLGELAPATGHTPVAMEEVAATCTTAGSTGGVICSACEAVLEEPTVVPANPDTHVYQLEKTLKEPTCSAPGIGSYKCECCGKTAYLSIEPLEHTWDEGTVTKEPTCTEDGEKTVTCTVCGAEDTVLIPNLGGHQWVEDLVDDVTNVVYKECGVCGQREITWSANDDLKNCFEGKHTPVEIPETETHYAGSKCSVCGTILEEPLAKCDHENTQLVNAVEATCTENGYTGDLVCQDCRATLETGKAIPAAGHTEEVIPGKEATCTETGLTEGKKCSVCGEVLTAQEEIPATGHTEEVIPGKEATCTETGLTEGKKCSVCGEVLTAQEEIPAIGHTEEVIPGKEATCTETGLTEGKKCSVCGEVLVAQEEIPMVAHNYVDGVCTACGAEDPDYVAPCTHENTETKNAVAATCTEDGYTGDTVCTDCGETLQTGAVIPATGHTVVTDAAVEATCTTDGKTEGSHCSVCEAVITAQETIPAKGHTPVDVPEVPATEESAGTTAGTKCSVCGEILSGCETIPPLSHEHVWDDGVETKAPTCTEAGEMTYTCSCGETRVETIPAKGHSYKVSVSYNDDYSKIIYTYTCSACGDSYKEEFDL